MNLTRDSLKENVILPVDSRPATMCQVEFRPFLYKTTMHAPGNQARAWSELL